MNEFYLPMKTREKVAGWIYLPIHVALIPIIILPLAYYALISNGVEIDEMQVNIIYYLIGLLYIFVFMLSYLRNCFTMEKKARLMPTVCKAFAIFYVLNWAKNIIMIFSGIASPNPNNDAVMEMVSQQIYTMTAIAVIMAPIVEEVLFRGVLFGTIRKKNRVIAYILSILLFSAYHVWSYVLANGDWIYLIAILDYIPASIALTWAYEKSNNIWYSILLHMIINGMAIIPQAAI